MECKASVTFE